jgi:hypothetical protein
MVDSTGFFSARKISARKMILLQWCVHPEQCDHLRLKNYFRPFSVFACVSVSLAGPAAFGK